MNDFVLSLVTAIPVVEVRVFKTPVVLTVSFAPRNTVPALREFVLSLVVAIVKAVPLATYFVLSTK